MMPFNARNRRQSILWAALLALFALATTGYAQDGPEPQPAQPSADVEAPQPVEPAEQPEKEEDLGPMTIEVDLESLIFDNRGNNFQDTVWRLQASPGKRILLLPFTVDNVHRTNKLARFPITIRTGRFIGFAVPKPEQDGRGRGGEGIDLNQIVRAAPGELQEMLFEKDDTNEQPETNNTPAEDADEPTPEFAPRLTREILLHPDGTVQWSMDRAISGGTVQSASESNPYGYKLDPEQLRAAQPEKADRITRNEGEDSRAFALRKREHQLAEREKVNAYRDLRDMLRRLPETFREPAPSVLYAVIEAPNSEDISLQGSAPLPWTLDAEKRQLFQKLAGGGKTLQDDRGVDISGTLITMIQDHPLDARAIAIATTRSRLAGQVETDDGGYKVLTRLLQSKDVPTRRIALYGVATTNPPTLASAKLIGVAGEAVMGEERKMLSFASLGKLFSTQADSPDNARVLMERVSQTIADPEGPAAPRVIDRVLAALGPDQNGGRRPEETDETTAAMIEALDLSGMTPEEYVGVAESIVKRSPDSPVAAGWLDQKLLGSGNHDLINKTLSLLYEAKIVPPSEPNRRGEPEPEPVVVEEGVTLLSGTIPMTRTDHALVGLFESDDDVQEAAAWAVLGKFHIALPDAEPTDSPEGTEEPPVDPALVMFDSILDKAKAREKVPASVVAFMANQKDQALAKPANDRLVGLLAEKDLAQKTALAALDAYIASPERYTQSIQALESSEKQQMMQSVYTSKDQQAPLMSGLIADQGNTLNWFSRHVKEQGELPTTEAWTEMAQSLGEQSLINSATSDDVVLCFSAAAALVVTAGGDEQQEQAFAQSVVLMEARSRDQVTKEWEKQRGKIYSSVFEEAQGTYKLIATLVSAEDLVKAKTEDPESTEPVPGKDVELGVVELRASDLDLSLSVEAVTLQPSQGRLGIQIVDPSSLRSFDKPDLSRIQPEHLREPIDLLPQEGGAWVGETTLRDGRLLRVTLEPQS